MAGAVHAKVTRMRVAPDLRDVGRDARGLGARSLARHQVPLMPSERAVPASPALRCGGQIH
jgi:hypothetical protein